MCWSPVWGLESRFWISHLHRKIFHWKWWWYSTALSQNESIMVFFKREKSLIVWHYSYCILPNYPVRETFNTVLFDSHDAEHFWCEIGSAFYLRTYYLMNTLSFTMWCYHFCGNHWLLCLLLWGAERPPSWIMWLQIWKKKKRRKIQTKHPQTPTFLFSDSNLGMGISILRILTDCGYTGCLLWLLHQYLLKLFKSANANPKVNHPWLVHDTVEHEAL